LTFRSLNRPRIGRTPVPFALFINEWGFFACIVLFRMISWELGEVYFWRNRNEPLLTFAFPLICRKDKTGSALVAPKIRTSFL
jgi:hypothetical protein